MCAAEGNLETATDDTMRGAREKKMMVQTRVAVEHLLTYCPPLLRTRSAALPRAAHASLSAGCVRYKVTVEADRKRGGSACRGVEREDRKTGGVITSREHRLIMFSYTL